MSFFFDQPTPSQSSQNQNTAFFQNGQAPKASIFDQHAQSQSQIAYDLFNIQSNQVEQKEKSIISKLDILDRIKEEESFAHHSTPFVPQQSNFKIQSQQSKMTFGNKLSNTLGQSKVQEKKEKKNRYVEDHREKESKNRLKLHEPLSNFSFYRAQHSSNTRLEEPQSMPIKFQQQKKASKKKFFDTTSSKSSSISIDFDQLRHRQEQQRNTTNSKILPLKLLNEDRKTNKIVQIPKSVDRNKQVQQHKNQRESLPPPKEKKFEFNLRKSRVTEQIKPPQPPPQKTFFTKINLANTVTSHGSATISNQAPVMQSKPPQSILKSDVKRVPQGNNLFKSRVKDTNQKVITPISQIKNTKQSQKGLFSLKTSADEFKLSKLQKSSKCKVPEEQRKTNDKYESLAQTFDKDSSLSVDSRSETSSKGKRESIGLKQQLKKLSSRPTEKVELKSIAFNKSFKFKQNKQASQQKSTQPTNKIQIKEIVKDIQDSMSEAQQKSKATVEKNYLLPVKTTRNSQFSHFMLTLIELQQESQVLRQRTIQSRNSYRQLAILNDDINRRIDQCLNKRK